MIRRYFKNWIAWLGWRRNCPTYSSAISLRSQLLQVKARTTAKLNIMWSNKKRPTLFLSSSWAHFKSILGLFFSYRPYVNSLKVPPPPRILRLYSILLEWCEKWINPPLLAFLQLVCTSTTQFLTPCCSCCCCCCCCFGLCRWRQHQRQPSLQRIEASECAFESLAGACSLFSNNNNNDEDEDMAGQRPTNWKVVSASVPLSEQKSR